MWSYTMWDRHDAGQSSECLLVLFSPSSFFLTLSACVCERCISHVGFQARCTFTNRPKKEFADRQLWKLLGMCMRLMKMMCCLNWPRRVTWCDVCPGCALWTLWKGPLTSKGLCDPVRPLEPGPFTTFFTNKSKQCCPMYILPIFVSKIMVK